MEDREGTGSPLRTQTQYRRTLGEEPVGPRLTAGPVFDRCIEAAICNKSAARAINLWKMAQALRGEPNFQVLVRHDEVLAPTVRGLVPPDLKPPIARRAASTRENFALKGGMLTMAAMSLSGTKGMAEKTQRGEQSGLCPSSHSSTTIMLDGRGARARTSGKTYNHDRRGGIGSHDADIREPVR